MNRIGMAMFALFFIGVGGYQALFPTRIIRSNMNRPMSWQPRWAREWAFSAPNVWATRLAGALCCIIGLGFLAKAAFGF